jgi:hypothetical protein
VTGAILVSFEDDSLIKRGVSLQRWRDHTVSLATESRLPSLSHDTSSRDSDDDALRPVSSSCDFIFLVVCGASPSSSEALLAVASSDGGIGFARTMNEGQLPLSTPLRSVGYNIISCHQLSAQLAAVCGYSGTVCVFGHTSPHTVYFHLQTEVNAFACGTCCCCCM